MISPYRIEWKRKTSFTYDLWTEIAFDSDNGEIETYLTREAISEESYDGVLNRSHGYRWTERLAPRITFVKKDYSDFSEEENRAILKWLTSSRNADFLDVYKDDSEVIAYSILGNFTAISQYKLANGRVAGYIASFESVLPWALSPVRMQTLTPDPETHIIQPTTVDVITDDPESLIYPKITIKHSDATHVISIDSKLAAINSLNNVVYHYIGDGLYYWTKIDADGTILSESGDTDNSGIQTTGVVLHNQYTVDGEQHMAVLEIQNNIIGETIVLDGTNQVISSSRTDGRIFADDFIDWSWLPLAEGENTISVIGNCTVTLEWREPIKCGDF